MPRFLTTEPAEALLATLGDALDLVDFGIVLLDRDMRVRFVNRRFVELSAVPEALLATGPDYREVLSRMADRDRYAVPPDELSTWLAAPGAQKRLFKIKLEETSQSLRMLR